LIKTLFTAKKLALSVGSCLKKQTCTAVLVSALLVLALAGSLFVNLAAANPGVTVNAPRSPPPTPIIKVKGLDTDKLTLTFSIQSEPWITPYGPDFFGYYEPSHEWSYYVSSEVFVDGKLWSTHNPGARTIFVSLEGLSNGWHTLEVNATAHGEHHDKDFGMRYSSHGSSGVIEFLIGNSPPPSVQIQSLKNTTSTEGDFQFALRVDGHTLSWVGYSLDGKENVTVNQEILLQSSLASHDKVWKGNLTVTGLSSGSHSLVVYAKDGAGNTGASATTEFTVAEETQAAALLVAWGTAAILVSAVAVSAGLLFYFKKRKRLCL